MVVGVGMVMSDGAGALGSVGGANRLVLGLFFLREVPRILSARKVKSFMVC